MPTNLQDQAQAFSQAQTQKYMSPEDQAQLGMAPPVTGNTTLLPGNRAVSQQTVPVDSPIGIGSAYKALDNVKSNVDRINAQFQAEVAARQAAKLAQQNSIGTSTSGVGQAWKADGSLSDSRNALLKDASSYIGSKYVLGGTTTKGIDCSGLVMQVYNKMGFNIKAHDATWQGKNIPGVRTSVKNLRPGDIVAWKDGSHIAIYAGNGEIIEAANTRVGTVRRKLWAPESAVVGIAVRLPGE